MGLYGYGMRSSLFILLYAGGERKGALRKAPYNGASHLKRNPLESLPSILSDEESSVMSINRLLPNFHNTKEEAVCRGAGGKDACLGVEGHDCMFISMFAQTIDGMGKSTSHCIPCVVEGEDIPCLALGTAVDPGWTVTDCAMRCPHQKVIADPGKACCDQSGFITQGQCFDRGTKAGAKCMFHSYVIPNGAQKSICGACKIPGGGFGCTAVGDDGPEDGSKVTFCLSQCDVICMGPPDCPPTVAPPPPPPPPSPGIVETSLKDNHQMLIAPRPFALPTLNPNHIIKAALDRKKVANWVSFCFKQCDLSCKIQPRCPLEATTPPDVLGVPTITPYYSQTVKNFEEVASWVEFCSTQCDFICSGPPYCIREPPPMDPEFAMSPGANAPPTLGPYPVLSGKAYDAGVVDWPVGSPPPPLPPEAWAAYFAATTTPRPTQGPPYTFWGEPTALPLWGYGTGGPALLQQKENAAARIRREYLALREQYQRAVIEGIHEQQKLGVKPPPPEDLDQPPPPKKKMTNEERIMLVPKKDAPTAPPAQFPPKISLVQAVSSTLSQWGRHEKLEINKDGQDSA